MNAQNVLRQNLQNTQSIRNAFDGRCRQDKRRSNTSTKNHRDHHEEEALESVMVDMSISLEDEILADDEAVTPTQTSQSQRSTSWHSSN